MYLRPVASVKPFGAPSRPHPRVAPLPGQQNPDSTPTRPNSGHEEFSWRPVTRMAAPKREWRGDTREEHGAHTAHDHSASPPARPAALYAVDSLLSPLLLREQGRGLRSQSRATRASLRSMFDSLLVVFRLLKGDNLESRSRALVGRSPV